MQRPRLGLHGFGEESDHLGVDRIGLGALADRLGEVAHLRRIDDDQRQRSASNRCSRYRLKATGRFDGNQLRRERPQPPDQLLQAFAVAANRIGPNVSARNGPRMCGCARV